MTPRETDKEITIIKSITTRDRGQEITRVSKTMNIWIKVIRRATNNKALILDTSLIARDLKTIENNNKDTKVAATALLLFKRAEEE